MRGKLLLVEMCCADDCRSSQVYVKPLSKGADVIGRARANF